MMWDLQQMIAYAEDNKGIADTTNLQCQDFRHSQKFADNNRE
jgi:hypothetical protein